MWRLFRSFACVSVGSLNPEQLQILAAAKPGLESRALIKPARALKTR